MARKNLKLRVDESGCLEVVDPGYDTLDLIRSINPEFEIKTEPLPQFRTPRFQSARKIGCNLSLKSVENEEEGTLWNLHNQLLNTLPIESKSRGKDEASLLDLKIELAYRVLKSCQLCGRRCGVDRTSGEKGVCGLGLDATVFEHFIHIAEEPQINPSLNLVLAGCGLQCVFCQQSQLLNPASIKGNNLKAYFWKKLDKRGARSLSFIGGNPDESLYAILGFLNDAPARWNLPVVWNCSGYATIETVSLLNGIVDAYVPDYKYGNPACGGNLAGAPEYSDIALAAIEAMLKQDVPVIVRILLLPGHAECCHIPILENLKAIDNCGNLFVSIRDQYCPEGIVKDMDNHPMNKRVTKEEAFHVREHAQNLHLKLTD